MRRRGDKRESLPVGLKRLFLTTSAVNASAAAFNLLTTVLLVRWFGAGVYADYLVDLAYLSLISILLEVVPSNYSIFCVQDDPNRVRGLAALAVITAFILAGVTLVSGYVFDFFQANSAWIAPYAGSLAVKRYLDTRLQSTGRLREYFGIELFGAAIRVVLLGLFLWWAVSPVDAVWASLACATLLTQSSWFARNPDERREFIAPVFDRSAWTPMIKDRQAYVPYYLGIAVKRLRDNLVPVLASYFFANKETLGAFFLAYRGLLFTAGQIRVIEGLLNHRHTLASVMELSFTHRALVAGLGQLVCIVASICLMYASGVDNSQFFSLIILSFAIWFYVFSIIERSRAYSNFDSSSINLAMISYCIVESGLVWLCVAINIQTGIVFSLILVCAEGISLLIMSQSAKYIRQYRQKEQRCILEN